MDDANTDLLAGVISIRHSLILPIFLLLHRTEYQFNVNGV